MAALSLLVLGMLTALGLRLEGAGRGIAVVGTLCRPPGTPAQPPAHLLPPSPRLSLQSELRSEGLKKIGVHNLSPGMVTTDLLMAGTNTPIAK